MEQKAASDGTINECLLWDIRPPLCTVSCLNERILESQRPQRGSAEQQKKYNKKFKYMYNYQLYIWELGRTYKKRCKVGVGFSDWQFKHFEA